MTKIWIISFSLFLTSCGFGLIDPVLLVGCGIFEKKSKIGASVASLDSPKVRLRESESMALVESPFLNPKCISCSVTFTPTSFKLHLKSMSVCPDSDGVACLNKGELTGIGIDVDQDFELIGQSPATSLGAFFQTVKAKEFGEYQGVGVQYPGKVHSVSGSVTIGSQTYVIDNVKSYASGGSGGAIKMASSFEISESKKPFINIYFDPLHSFALGKCSGLGESAWMYPPTTSHPEICVSQNTLNFIPYAGGGVPSTKRFEVRFDSDGDGVMDEGYYLSVLFLVDPSGEVAGVLWTNVTEASYDFEKAKKMETRYAVPTPVKNSDGSYKLTARPSYAEKDTSSGLTIESFWLKDHSGKGTFKSINIEKTVSYTAKEL
ncbi:MAG: hypothetical protein HQK54_12235 [Oligoflexales bacterium]|nr:hypothetical protein [Oligoflexales bacterium]